MSHKVESIDYLRGLSILAIIVIHILAWHDTAVLTQYTQLPFLFSLREFLQFSVVAVVLCSGFSLYLSHSKLSLKSAEIWTFYKKRFKHLLLPWWVFLAVFFSVHLLLKLVYNLELINLSAKYVLSSFLMVGGIGIGWLVLLMLILTLLFPFLKYMYDTLNKKVLFSVLAAVYIGSVFLFSKNPLNIMDFPFATGLWPSVVMSFQFIIGWSTIYMVGFLLEQFYNKHPFVIKELQLTIGFTVIFLITFIIYYVLKLNRRLYLNKYPPSPLYLSFGLMASFILLTVFFLYKHFIHIHFKKLLAFFSSNSFWLFIWSALTLSLISPLTRVIQDIYLRLVIEVTLNITGVVFLVLLQKKLIKIEMHLEQHHF
jgi:surface polysaccharide O-acyltransferase-like enzyme